MTIFFPLLAFYIVLKKGGKGSEVENCSQYI